MRLVCNASWSFFIEEEPANTDTRAVNSEVIFQHVIQSLQQGLVQGDATFTEKFEKTPLWTPLAASTKLHQLATPWAHVLAGVKQSVLEEWHKNRNALIWESVTSKTLRHIQFSPRNCLWQK